MQALLPWSVTWKTMLDQKDPNLTRGAGVKYSLLSRIWTLIPRWHFSTANLYPAKISSLLQPQHRFCHPLSTCRLGLYLIKNHHDASKQQRKTLGSRYGGQQCSLRCSILKIASAIHYLPDGSSVINLYERSILHQLSKLCFRFYNLLLSAPAKPQMSVNVN